MKDVSGLIAGGLAMNYVYSNYQMSSWPVLLGIGGYFVFFCVCVLGIIMLIRRPWRRHK